MDGIKNLGKLTLAELEAFMEEVGPHKSSIRVYLKVLLICWGLLISAPVKTFLLQKNFIDLKVNLPTLSFLNRILV
jgi:hypothetical protein